MAETIVLDPTAVATGRTQVDITSYIAAAGPDWGDAELEAYKASLKVGEVRLEYRLPNRLIKIPLILRQLGATTFQTIRSQIQAKVGLMQREGGWLMRQAGSTPLYADVQSVTLHLGGSWMQAYRNADVDAVLAIECLPDWYGDEVTLTTHTETVLPHLFFTEGVVNGNSPGRVRVVVTNGTAVDQHGLLWGIRSRYYDAGTTAALFYEGEALQAVNGAAGTALAGASGGSAMALTVPASSVWVSMLSAAMMPGTVALTHAGSYRVWARAYSATATPRLRFQWGNGGLSQPITNDPVVLPGTAAFYMLDLGGIRIDAPPVAPNQWAGVVQANVNLANDPVMVDCLYFQPLDDGAGRLTYIPAAPASSIAASTAPTVAANDTAVGTQSWSNPSRALALDSLWANNTPSPTATTNYLKLTGFGNAIPASATIVGIQFTFYYQTSNVTAIYRAVKAGTVQAGTSPSVSTALGTSGGDTITAFGGPTDLWGTSWSVSDVNNSGFGVAVYATAFSSGTILIAVNYVTATVYYTLASGFTVAQDAVIAASKTIELRTDGMYRQAGGGTIYGPVSNVIGDLPRIPPSGLEGRTIQVFLKASRGEFNNEPDSAIDDLSAQIIYRPSYLYAGTA